MTLRPIAGTTPRGKTPEEDAALERELLADPKERAEHVMLIDLGRNDVGRVAEVGSVKVVRQMEVERYSHVMHIVSEVHRARPALDAAARGRPRGVPGGHAVGRARSSARCKSSASSRPARAASTAARSATLRRPATSTSPSRSARPSAKTTRFFVTAGAGIVEASDPAKEAEETRSKARSALCAIETAGR